MFKIILFLILLSTIVYGQTYTKAVLVDSSGNANITTMIFNNSPVLTNVNNSALPAGTITNNYDQVLTLKTNLILQGALSLNSLSSPVATYSITDKDNIIRASGTFNITLPACTGSGRVLYIKNIGTGLITVLPNGTDKIDEDTDKSFSQNTSIVIIDTAAGKWEIF